MSSPHKASRIDMKPAYYAAKPGGWRDWWTLLHPPYTVWHLSYVVIGACLAPVVHTDRLIAAVLAFLLAVGIGAHAVDELNGRPLHTDIASRWLIGAAALGVTAAITIGAIGVSRVGWPLIPFIVLGPILVIGYNFNVLTPYKDIVFAAAWGGFPVLTAYVAETGTLRLPAIGAAGAAGAISIAQRSLSTPARLLRRRTRKVAGHLSLTNGEVLPIDREMMLRPIERALGAISAGMVFFATAIALARLT